MVSAFRNFQRSRVYVILNLLGLTLGFAVFISLFLFTAHEKSYDIFSGSDRVFRLKGIRANQDGSRREAVTSPFAAGPDIKSAFPEVEEQVRVVKTIGMIYYEDRWSKTEDVAYADAGFFQVFSMPLVHGNTNRALAEINSIVLSASFAKQIFGSENPIGKQVGYKGRLTYEVTGVFPDFPENSHLKFDALLSFKNYELVRTDIADEPWQWEAPITYLRLRTGVEAAGLQEKLGWLIEEKCGEFLREIDQQYTIELQPVNSIHLHSHLVGELRKNGDGDLVKYLESIAYAILFLALFNYVSFSTAKSIERSKEVGIRKVMGSRRYQLVVQFLVESLLLHFISLILAIGVLALSYQYLQEHIFSFKDLLLIPSTSWLTLCAIFISVALTSGLYPAMILSSYDPSNALKGKISGSSRGAMVRKVLVIVQFATSLVLIIWIFVVMGQLRFMRETQLGFELNRLVIRDSEVYDSLFDRNSALYKMELARLPSVRHVSYVGMLPGDHNLFFSAGVRRPSAPTESATSIEYVVVDETFDTTYGLEILAGNGFKKESMPWKEIILNESAMRAVGFNDPEDAIGEKILFLKDTPRIARVVKDFHFHSPKESVKPLAFLFAPHMGYYFTLDFEPHTLPEVTEGAQTLFASIYPGQPFSHKLLSDHFNAQYESEITLEQALYFFSGLSICITCLGLLGMATYTTQIRKKEIGIRKTLGATTVGVLLLLWREHFLTIFLSTIVAVPVSWYLSTQWLMSFVTRIELTPILFIEPLAILIAISLGTVLMQTLRAALANPVDSIKYE